MPCTCNEKTSIFLAVRVKTDSGLKLYGCRYFKTLLILIMSINRTTYSDIEIFDLRDTCNDS